MDKIWPIETLCFGRKIFFLLFFGSFLEGIYFCASVPCRLPGHAPWIHLWLPLGLCCGGSASGGNVVVIICRTPRALSSSPPIYHYDHRLITTSFITSNIRTIIKASKSTIITVITAVPWKIWKCFLFLLLSAQ